jgi:hypothetical protein
VKVPGESSLRIYGILLGGLLVLGGCAHDPVTPDLAELPTPQPPAPFAPVSDERAAFRKAFCARLPAGEAQSPDCADLLWRLRDEAGARPAATDLPPIPPERYRVVLVTGAFGDCAWRHMLPFDAAIGRLRARGVAVDAVMAGGRSSAEHNARQIADAVEAIDSPLPLILVGYSKGVVDILQFLATYPEPARRVAAVIGFAGPVFGSPLAVEAGDLYRKLPREAFGSLCEPGDGGVFESLRPDTRRHWLAANELPGHVHYYSVAAFTTYQYLSRGLRHAWRELAAADPRNDGQVVLGDALIPGSTLLALANADHWDLAIAMEEQVPWLSSRPDPRIFPRDLLFEAALDYVAFRLTDAGTRR